MKHFMRYLMLSSWILVGIAVEARAAVPSQPSIVTVQGTKLILQKRLHDGTLSPPTPYTIKGVDWSPATQAPATGPIPPGYPYPTANSDQYGFFFHWAGRNPDGPVVMNYWLSQQHQAYYQQDIPLMAQMHVNTVRLYGDFGDDPTVYGPILDTFYNNHIMVIMTVPASQADIASGRYLQVMSYCQNHPAILMWAVGNEWNLTSPPNVFYGYSDFPTAVTALNQAIQQMKAQDHNHPISSSLGDQFSGGLSNGAVPAIVSAMPAVDVWAFNIYRGATFGTAPNDIFTQWAAASTKPFYFSEFGIDSFNTTAYTQPYPSGAFGAVSVSNDTLVTGGYEDQATQSTWDLGLWNLIQAQLSSLNNANSCLGGFVFSWNDALWKVGNYNVNLGGLTNETGTSYMTQDPSGFYLPGAFPDNVDNEEYFGIVNASRVPKQAYQDLQAYYPTVAPLPVASTQFTLSNTTFDLSSSMNVTAQALDVFEEPVPAAIISRFTWTVTPQQGTTGVQTVTTTQGVLNLATLNLLTGTYLVAVQAFGTNGAVSTIAQTMMTLVAADFSALRVYPSPWRSDLHGGHPITFDGLTANTTVKIFTVSGHWVRTLGPGNGVLAWDLKNDSGDLVASGLYFYLLSNDQGQKGRGKFAIIR